MTANGWRRGMTANGYGCPDSPHLPVDCPGDACRHAADTPEDRIARDLERHPELRQRPEDQPLPNAEALRRVRELAEEWKGESVSAMKRADVARERNDRVLYTTNVRHARVIRQAATALLAALDGEQGLPDPAAADLEAALLRLVTVWALTPGDAKLEALRDEMAAAGELLAARRVPF